MKTLKIARTVFPKDRPSDFNQWAMYFWGIYATEMAKVKTGWDKNEYKPKKQK
jgi:hypothetical protein